MKRIRAWARDAQRSQVVTAAIVGATAIAFAGVFAVPNKADETVQASETLGPADSAQASDAAPGADGAAAATAQGGAAVGTSGAQPATASTGATRVSGGSQQPGRSDAGTPSASGSRTASDQGVTADQIKLGFTISRTGGLTVTGFALGIRQDQPEAVKAMVDSVNKAGGVQGRKLTYVVVEEDPTDASTWQPACIRLTEDEKVFSVIESAQHLGSGHICYIEHKMPNPTAASSTMAASLFQRGGGYLASTGADGTRGMLNWAAYMLASGVIGPGKGTLGLLTDECPQDVEIFDHDVKPFLKSQGVKFAESRLSCDIGAAQQQVPAAVLQLRNAGVNRVFLGVIFTTAQTFMQQAESQRWRPKYAASDLWGNDLDFLAQNFPPDQFDRTQATTFTHQGEEASKIPYSEPTKRCSKILSDAGLPPVTDQMGKDAEIVGLCDSFFLWLAVMQKLPVNFTRAQWAAAVPSLGSLQGAYGASARFGLGKFDGGDTYALLEWRRECTCWAQIKPHTPGRF